MKASQFEFIGLGYNKTDMEPLDLQIKIYLYEQNSAHDGSQMNENTELEFSTTGANNKITTGKSTISGDVIARWMPLGANRLTAPTLRVGERVKVWKESDTGKYWWSYLGLDEGLRRLETVVWGISATEDTGVNGRQPENMYWLEMSSHSQKIALSTSNKLGEACTYQFYFDLKEGKVVLLDSIGNEIMLDSVEKIISLLNADGTYYKLNKKNIEGFAPDNISFKAGKSFSVTAGTSVDIKAGTTMALTARVSTTLTTPVFNGIRG